MKTASRRHTALTTAQSRSGPALILFCAILAFAGAARGAVVGQLEARAQGPQLPQGAAVAILPGADDLELLNDPVFAAARDAVARTLGRRGMRVSDSGPFKLKFDIHRALPGPPEPRSEGPIEPEPMGRDIPEVVNQFAIPLQRPAADSDSAMSVSMILYDETGTALWSATAAADVTGEPVELAQRLSTAAVAQIGANVKRNLVSDCTGVEPPPSDLCLE